MSPAQRWSEITVASFAVCATATVSGWAVAHWLGFLAWLTWLPVVAILAYTAGRALSRRHF